MEDKKHADLRDILDKKRGKQPFQEAVVENLHKARLSNQGKDVVVDPVQDASLIAKTNLLCWLKRNQIRKENWLKNVTNVPWKRCLNYQQGHRVINWMT